ncbi:MAG: hypothetical protein AB1714_09310 [Acidobacteriota bacterium]
MRVFDVEKRCGRRALFFCALSVTLWSRATAAQDRNMNHDIRIELPADLEGERDRYREDILAAVDRVAAWFTQQGFETRREDLIDRAVVLGDIETAQTKVAAHFGVDRTAVPDSFSGTVDQKTLFVVCPEVYRKTYIRLYPDWPWDEAQYRGLIAHEVAHRAHARVAVSLHGSEEAMGPTWFFEGLAILCAGNFEARVGDSPQLTWEQLMAYVSEDGTKSLGYPTYGRMIRSLAAAFPAKLLIERASDRGFPQFLEEGYAARKP